MAKALIYVPKFVTWIFNSSKLLSSYTIICTCGCWVREWKRLIVYFSIKYFFCVRINQIGDLKHANISINSLFLHVLTNKECQLRITYDRTDNNLITVPFYIVFIVNSNHVCKLGFYDFSQHWKLVVINDFRSSNFSDCISLVNEKTRYWKNEINKNILDRSGYVWYYTSKLYFYLSF